MRVKLTYYKATGKYYSEGEYQTSLEHMHEIWDEVDKLRTTQTLPGIMSDCWIISVDVPDHPHNHPHLLNTLRAVRTHDIAERSW